MSLHNRKQCRPPYVYTYLGFDIEGRDPCENLHDEKSCVAYSKCKWGASCQMKEPRPNNDKKWYSCQDPYRVVFDKTSHLLPIAKKIGLTRRDQIVLEGSFVMVDRRVRLVFPEITSCSVWVFELDNGLKLGYHAEAYQFLEGLDKFKINYKKVLRRVKKLNVKRVWIVCSPMFGAIAEATGHLSPLSDEFYYLIEDITKAPIKRYEQSDCWVTFDNKINIATM